MTVEPTHGCVFDDDETARCGWDRGSHRAVLFYATGGKMPPRQPGAPSRISDEALTAIADEGREIMRREFFEKVRDWREKHGHHEGEEWKP